MQVLKYPGSKQALSWNKQTFSSYDERGNLRKETVWLNYQAEPSLFEKQL